MARFGSASLGCSGLVSLLSALVIICFLTSTGEALIGVNYGRLASNLPSPLRVVKLIRNEGFKKAKIFDADKTTIRAFANSGIELIVGVPNDQLPSMGTSFDKALIWVKENISPHIPATQISAISVGNEILTSSPDFADYLVPAMKNVYSALKKLELDDHVKVSSPHALTILSSSYPPSAGTFEANLAQKIMKPMLEFLNQTNSYAMVNVYPFYAYKADSNVPFGYANFHSSTEIQDSETKLNYTNLFDAMLDSWHFAMKRLGFVDLKVVVTESGWPSEGEDNERGCTLKNAAAYNQNLVKHIASKRGTPSKPKIPIEAYIFALFNENMKPGPVSERNYGLLWPNGTKVYDFELIPPPHQGESDHSQESPPPGGSNVSDKENEGISKSSARSFRLRRAHYNVYLPFQLMCLPITLLALALHL